MKRAGNGRMGVALDARGFAGAARDQRGFTRRGRDARGFTRRGRDERGFTIVEAMVAIAVMGVAFLGVGGVHAISSRAQSLGQNRGLARYVADQQLEMMRATPLTNIASQSAQTVTVQGVRFQRTQVVANVPMGRRVQVNVTWTDRFGNHALQLATVVSQVTNQS